MRATTETVNPQDQSRVSPIVSALDELRLLMWRDYTQKITDEEAVQMKRHLSRGFIAFTHEPSRLEDREYSQHIQEFASYLHWGHVAADEGHRSDLSSLCLDFGAALVLDPNNTVETKYIIAKQFEPEDKFNPVFDMLGKHVMQMIGDGLHKRPSPLIPRPMIAATPFRKNIYDTFAVLARIREEIERKRKRYYSDG